MTYEEAKAHVQLMRDMMEAAKVDLVKAKEEMDALCPHPYRKVTFNRHPNDPKYMTYATCEQCWNTIDERRF